MDYLSKGFQPALYPQYYDTEMPGRGTSIHNIVILMTTMVSRGGPQLQFQRLPVIDVGSIHLLIALVWVLG